MNEYKTQDYEQIPYQVAELNKQIILLKAENKELKKQIKYCKECAEQLGKHIVAEQCLDEIEKIVNYGSVSYNNHRELADFYEDKIEEIKKLIKQAKEDGE